MKAPRPRAATPRTPRRWRTPPPLTRSSSETLEGIEILREAGGDTGVLLWQSYRNVMFWATADPADRGKMFSPEAGRKRLEAVETAELPAPLVEPLTTVARMLAAPAAAPGDAVAAACTAIAGWAEGKGHVGTTLAFTQAGALAAPGNATLPYQVGQIARGRHELARAETWYRHAIMIGRQIGDWESYARAYVALGHMFLKRGNYPVSHRMHIKAIRAARRKGLVGVQGPALHDLFVISAEGNRNAQAQQYARLAFRAYSGSPERLAKLAADVAYFWLREGHYTRVIPVFEALVQHAPDAPNRMIRLANLARAAGGAGMREAFRKAWVEVTRLAREPEVLGVTAGCMLDLARGAASLGEWDRAERAAEQAYTVARERGEAQIVVEADELLTSVRDSRQVRPVVEVRSGDAAEVDADQLATEMVRSLALAA